MPGALTHAYIFKKHHPQIVGSILPDFLPFFSGMDWEETHDLDKARRFKRYLKKNDRNCLWLAKGMINHIYLDKAAFKNKYLAVQREKISKRLGGLLNLNGAKLEDASDFFMDLAFDGVIQQKKGNIAFFVKNSFKEINLQRVSFHIAKFFNKDKSKIERGLEYLKNLDFEKAHTFDGASAEYLKYYQNNPKNGILVRMYGIYLSRILKKNKKEFEKLTEESQKSLLETEKKQLKLNKILNHFKNNIR